MTRSRGWAPALLFVLALFAPAASAGALGLTLPPSLVLRADEVVP